jgi:hypothetical protein
MPEGVLVVLGDGEGDDATERSGRLLLVDERRAEGIAEGKALRLGCPGNGECCAAMKAESGMVTVQLRCPAAKSHITRNVPKVLHDDKKVCGNC